MLNKIFVLLLLSYSVVGYNFTDYVAEFHKTYANADEWLFRQGLFEANYTVIVTTNAQNLGYTLAVNNFTDWTYAEFRGN